MEKTLVILIGNARGGEETWQTMYNNLLEPYNADLALCFGWAKNKSLSLYDNAKYIWEIPEYQNWRDYYSNIFKDDWDHIFKLNQHTGLMGGIDDSIGSGSIIFAFRDYIIRNKKDILLKYNRIILTRSDYYYIDKHPVLPLGKFYVTEGEDYGGITDRHHIFDSAFSDHILGICDFLCSKDNFEYIKNRPEPNLNPEKALLLYFQYNQIINVLERCKRVQFTVASDNDSTRWCKPSDFILGSDSIRHKYMSEYELVINNLKNK